jgi:hypothetical protein
MMSGGGLVQDETYPYRRLLGAVLLEALEDALNLRGNVAVRRQREALEFLRDGHVQSLCNASLSLPRRLWGVFEGGPDHDLGIDYARLVHGELLLDRHAGEKGALNRQDGHEAAGQTATSSPPIDGAADAGSVSLLDLMGLLRKVAGREQRKSVMVPPGSEGV